MLIEGQRHASPEAIPLLDQALHRLWPDAVAGDKGYSSTDIRNWLQSREIETVIPRRVATRYEKLAATYLAMVTLAMILEWL